MKKIKRILILLTKGILVVLSVLLVIGIIYENIARNGSKHFLEERTGNFLDVGGHKLYFEKEGKGDLTVIFEAGSPADHRIWESIVANISKHTTTLTYDRAGLLWSERGLLEKNPKNISTDLETLLNNGGFKKPYVIVGHSAAGRFLRPFIEKNQDDILGVVFIDPSHPEQYIRVPENLRKYMGPTLPPNWLLKLMDETGLFRLYIGDRDQLIYKSIKSGGFYDEVEFLHNEMKEESSNLNIPNTQWEIPLTIISAGQNGKNFAPNAGVQIQKEVQEYWDSLQIEISKLSSKGKRIIAEKSGHMMLKSESKLISDEILKIIQLKDNIKND